MPLYFFLALGFILLAIGIALWMPMHYVAEVIVEGVTGYAGKHERSDS